MTCRDTREYCAGLHGLAINGIAGRDGSQCPGSGNTERRHGLADDVFAQDGTGRGSAVTTAGERCGSRALQLNVISNAVKSDDFSKQIGASVSELRHKMTKLVSGIGLRQGLGSHRHTVASQYFDTFCGRKRHRIQLELSSQLYIQLDQAWERDGGRIQPSVESLRQSCVSVVK